MKTSRVLLIGWMALALGTSARAQVADHLKCYRIKDTFRIDGTADLNTPQFGADAGCTVKKAKLFCVPATKTNVAVTDKATGTPITPLPVSGPQPGDRICYKVRCLAPPPADQSVTDQFGNRTVSQLKASLVCTPAFKDSVRFVYIPVGGTPGTVIDNYTGLLWELKYGSNGVADYNEPHDVDNTYTWNTAPGGTNPNGTAFTDFLGRLNDCTQTSNPGFAGHCDWRLPTIQELNSIVDLTATGCGSGSPCIPITFGSTAASFYWSATTNSFNTAQALYVNFNNGGTNNANKDLLTLRVRAVRGP